MLSRLTLPPGRYQIHVGAHETTGGATGTVPYDLEVPDSAKAGFGLSGIVVTSSRADLLVTANPDPVLKDALPGAPTATRRFSTSETLSAYVEAYDAPRRAGAVALVVRVRDADGRKVFESKDRRDGNAADRVNGFRTDVPLKGWAPGQYVLEVEATGGAGASARRSIPFDVTNP
jgi:hypothetical protein